MKFPRTIQFDISDKNTFPVAAEPDEWALTGTFAFTDSEPQQLSNKEQLAFRNGWLGIGSFGFSTFVVVAEITQDQFETVISRIAGHLFEHYEAPDMLAAAKAARIEADYAANLCHHPLETILALAREFTEEGIRERIHVISKQTDTMHAKIWAVVNDDGEN